MSYTITSVRETGTITYHCCSTQRALDKLHDFQRADYREISIVGSDEHRVSEGQLVLRLCREVGVQVQS